MGRTWPQTALKHKYKLNIIEINVRINTESFCFHLVSYLYLMYQNFLACAVEVCAKFSIHSTREVKIKSIQNKKILQRL